MSFQYEIFYKNHGVRRVQQLLRPWMFGEDQFAFPRNSLFHFVSHDDTPTNIDAKSTIYKGVTKRILMDCVVDLAYTEGQPKHRVFNPLNLSRKFLSQHKNFKYTKVPYIVNKDINTLLVESYGLIPAYYKYPKMSITPYRKWRNLEHTVWHNIASITQSCDRNQFIFYNAPDVIPSVATLRQFVVKEPPALLHFFGTPEKLFVRELWKWLDEDNRATSIIDAVPKDKLKLVNLVFFHDGKWALLNLGMLDSFRIDKNDDPNIKVHAIKFKPLIIQKFMLKFFMTMISNEEISEEDTAAEISQVETTNPQTEVVIAADNDEISEAENTGDKDKIVLNAINNSVPQQAIIVKEFSSVVDQHAEIMASLIDVDKDLEVLTNIEAVKLKQARTVVSGDEILDKGTITEEEVAARVSKVITSMSIEVDPNEAAKLKLHEYAEYGTMSAADYRKALKQIEAFEHMPDPYGSGVTFNKASKIKPEELKISAEQLTTSDTIVDKSILASATNTFDKHYVKNIRHKDILNAVKSVQKTGVIIQDYNVEKVNGSLGAYEAHTLKLKPLDGGTSSIIHFKIPVVEEDSTFQINGNKCILRKQRTEIPIRKVDSITVALTSYYGKTFIRRSEYSVNDADSKIAKFIIEKGTSGLDPNITKVAGINCYDNKFKSPRIYGALAHHIKFMTVKGNEFVFDHRDRFELASDADIEKYETNGFVICGKTKSKNLIVIGPTDEFYFIRDDGIMTPIGNIYDILGLSQLDAPVDYSSIRVFSKSIPVGLMLSYLMGFSTLVALLKTKYRIVEGSKQRNLLSNEWIIKFKDQTYVFDRNDKLATLILGGFTAYKECASYDFDLFNEKDVYLNLLESKKISAIYVREMDLMDTMFVDPITLDILKDMKMPISFQGLLLESSKMLLTCDHPDFQDMAYMRIKGYERVAGIIYKELSHSIRAYQSRTAKNRQQIELNPYAIWGTVTKDSGVKLVEEINPIQDLKERDAVTYSGEGGRDSGTINKANRAYHESDVGVISEATVDSGDVGVNTYLSANPKFTSVRGLVDTTDDKLGIGNKLSPSALLAPCSDNDDMKRVNFVNIQQSHTISTIGYRQPLVQTGFENVIPYRTSSMFAVMADKDGTVISLNEFGIIVKFSDGELKGVKLGKRYGKAEGSTYPHTIVTPLKMGGKFKAGEPIAYNSNFFEEDFFNKKKLVMKSSLNTKVALMESSQTHEDCSSISANLHNKLTTKTIKTMSFVVEFKQGIRAICKVGSELTPKSILMIIEDETTANMDIFDEKSVEALKRLSNKAPKAKVNGKLDKIEVFYHGDKADMSPSLRKLANESDNYLKDVLKSSNDEIYSCEVTEDYRVGGNPLLLDRAEIKMHIEVSLNAGVGDKGVFANQMKSVFGEVLDYDIVSEDGEVIDSIFGYRSIANRVVLSPLLIGTTSTLLKLIGNKAAKIYFGEK